MGKKILSTILTTALLIAACPFGIVNADTIPTADVTVTTWSDLQNAVTSATSAKVIKLGSDIVAPNPTSNSSISIASGKNITVDLNGHVLDRGLIASDGTATANGHGSVFELSGTLTIVDGNPNAEHKGTLSENGYFWNWDDGTNTGESVIKGGIITGGCRSGNYNGGSGIRVDNDNARLNMSGGTITGNKSLNKAHAGGVYVNKGIFTMTGGEIKYNTAVQHGAGVFIRYGSFNMSGTAKISYNSVSANGGGVYLMSNTNSSFTMNGGEISYNKGKDGGGVRTESSMTINGGTIANNTATGEGGGVRGTVIMNGGEISNNTSAGNGGGVRGITTMTAGKITKNTSNGGGGGVYGNITMTGGSIVENTSKGNGGGVYMDASATLGGSAVVSGNFKGETTNNFFVGTDKTIAISDSSAPTEDMNIGITTAVLPEISLPVAITSNGSDGDVDYFISDNPSYYVLYQDSILKLVKDANPTGEIVFEENSFTSFLSSITFNLFFKDKFDVVINAADDIAVKTVEYYISDHQLTAEEVAAITEWETYSKFSIESEDQYIVYAKITDSIDNVTYISSDGFTLDMTAPVINGLIANKTYYTSQKFTVTEDYLNKVLIDEVEATEYELNGDVDKVYHITVTDKAGNKVEDFQVTMKPIASISTPIDELTVDNVKLSNKATILNVKSIAEGIDTTNASDIEKEEIQQIIDNCNLLLNAIDEKYPSSPNTGDNIISYLAFGAVSLVTLLACTVLSKK